jgi:DNA primase
LARPAINPADSDARRGRILTAILIAHPALLADVEEAYALIDLPADCARLRAALAKYHDAHVQLDTQGLVAHLNEAELSGDLSGIFAMLPASAAPEASLAEAAQCWWHFFGLMRASLNRLREQRDEQHFRHQENPDDPEGWARLIRLNAALRRAQEGEVDAERS